MLDHLPEHGSLDVWMCAAVEDLPLRFVLEHDLPQFLPVNVAILQENIMPKVLHNHLPCCSSRLNNCRHISMFHHVDIGLR